MKDLTGNFYTTEHDESILEFVIEMSQALINVRDDGFLEFVEDKNRFYLTETKGLLEEGSDKLSKQEFMVRIGMVAPEDEDLFEADREVGILKAENQMFKDNIRVLKEHINLLQERLDVAQNNCKIRETLQQNAEQHNYITAKKFNDTLAENHKLREQIKQLENK